MKDCVDGSRIQLSWLKGDGDELNLVAYDGKNNEELVYLLIDYNFYLSGTVELSQKTVINEIQFVKRFLEYLLDISALATGVTDVIFKRFRDAELKRVLHSRNRSGSDNAAKRTVNAKLRRIYLFLEWVQQTQAGGIFLIGPRGCQVRSSLGEGETKYSVARGRKVSVSDRDRFPLLYRSVGEGSKHRTKYVASTENKGDLVDHFLETHSSTLAQRNILILELADQVGMRRGSINSLRVDQFPRGRIESSNGDWEIIPPSQKFGYEKRYTIPFRLAFRICDYIEQVRKPLLCDRGWSEARTEGRLFVSLKNGKPLSDRTLSQIFGKGFRNVGVDEHGAGVHSFRRKFATDNIVQETERRRRLNLDTSVSSIAATVSLKMGHTSPESLTPYVSRCQAYMSDSAEGKTVKELARLQDENQRLKLELAKVRETVMVNVAKRPHLSRKKKIGS